ncbi:DUF2520 domain-containing protein [Coxiella endosymbiont of Amblyomma sculptum]|uniref:Rossmann-like and DUF2520 domain-containing protein n=1 Tax=Coxiella endosymbiont of Amblyomma sculptum TaxID=2487929 RepID=UPI00132F282C|nr:Rossmann-like and DUF2520 domain-containing protein [Coxiella endosymbiont of Amblyomma sculptum]QHG92287.1 DUF2520 domain-containing protein [Coxiella endosymbiont of Amblyomma sculptum]
MSVSIKINFIGAGRVGKTIAKQIVDKKAAVIQGVHNLSLESAKEAITYIGQGMAFKSIRELPSSDITFITTYDDAIADCCQDLAKSCNLKRGSIVLHCSGSLSSDLLTSVKKRDCYIASVHPMRSFLIPPKNKNSDRVYSCTFEGDKKSLSLLSSLFGMINYSIYPINKQDKSICHIASVFASNYLVTLYDKSLSCLKNSEITEEDGFEIILNLMKSTLDNLEFSRSTSKSLTGPISRGDLGTIKRHLQKLSNANNLEIKKLYQVLGFSTVTLTDLPDSKKETFFRIFSYL